MSNFDIIFLVFLYVILSLLLIITIIKNIKEHKKITIYIFFLIYFLLVYGITPIVSILYIHIKDIINSYYFTKDVSYYYLLFFITIIFLFLFLFFYKLLSKVNKKNLIKKEINVQSNSFFITTLFISLLGIVSLVLWTKAYGKPWDIIKYANAIRSGYSPIYNNLTFLKPFCSLIIVAFYANVSMLKKTKFKFLNFLDMMINLFFSIIYLLANDGRMFMLVFILTIFLYRKNKNLKLKPKIVSMYIIIGLITISALGRLDDLTYYIRNGKENINNSQLSLSNVIHNEFTFTYRNGINVLYLNNNYNLEIHEFKDIKNIAFAWVPERFNRNKENLTKINTSYYYNAIGVIPTDIITASIFKFNYVGVVIMPFIVSCLLHMLENFFSKYNSSYMDIMYNFVACNICLRFIAYYDLSDILYSSFYLIISFIIIIGICAKNNNINKRRHLYE